MHMGKVTNLSQKKKNLQTTILFDVTSFLRNLLIPSSFSVCCPSLRDFVFSMSFVMNSRDSSLTSPLVITTNISFSLSFRPFLKDVVTRKEPSGVQGRRNGRLELRNFGSTNGSTSH